MANTYKCSDESRVTQGQIDSRVRKAKQQKIEEFEDFHNRKPFCQTCKRNDCTPVDCSHNISVKEAKESGRTELCWDKDNITFRGRKCHQILDKLNVQFTQIK